MQSIGCRSRALWVQQGAAIASPFQAEQSSSTFYILLLLRFTAILMLHISSLLACLTGRFQVRWLRQHWIASPWLTLTLAWAICTSSPEIAILRPAHSDALLITPPHPIEVSPQTSLDLQQGKQLFQQNCTACHIHGQNLIIPYKNLEYGTLKTYRMNSLEAISRQVQYGKNVMPAFGEALSMQQIHNIAAYVLQQSENGW